MIDDKLEFRKPFEKWCTFGKHWVDTEFDKRVWHRRQCPDCCSEVRIQHYNNNKEWYKKYFKDYYRRNKQSEKDKTRKRRYGITSQQLRLLYEKQHGLCLVCMSHLRTDVNVDHIHGTTIVRGLLHKYCNLELGVIEKYQNNGWLDNAIDYLNRPYNS